MKAVDLTGRKFNRLTVIGFSYRIKYHIYWHCICECGNESIVETSKLNSGHTKSCGCFNRENIKKIRLTHGDSANGKRSRLYTIWTNIKQRCYNEKATNYLRYGKLGIKMCEEWYEYDNFKVWALNNGYEDSLTIDRINSKGNYEPINCRWVSYLQQGRNQKTNKLIEYNGKTMCLSEWCELLGIKYGRTLYRLDHGYSFEEAIKETDCRNKSGLEQNSIGAAV